MPRKKLSRNAPCPCGSGKKYKQCCLRKDFDWVEDDEGNIFKAMPISDEIKDVLDNQHDSFLQQYGREPALMICFFQTCLTPSTWNTR